MLGTKAAALLAPGSALALSLWAWPLMAQQGYFPIGTYWAPADESTYTQVADAGFDLIIQPGVDSVQFGAELDAAQANGLNYISSSWPTSTNTWGYDANAAHYASGQLSFYEEELFTAEPGVGEAVNDPQASGGVAYRAEVGTNQPGLLAYRLQRDWEQEFARNYTVYFGLKVLDNSGSDQVATLQAWQRDLSTGQEHLRAERVIYSNEFPGTGDYFDFALSVTTWEADPDGDRWRADYRLDWPGNVTLYFDRVQLFDQVYETITTDTDLQQRIRNHVGNWNSHPALFAWYTKDEPRIDMFDAWSFVDDVIRSVTPPVKPSITTKAPESNSFERLHL